MNESLASVLRQQIRIAARQHPDLFGTLYDLSAFCWRCICSIAKKEPESLPAFVAELERIHEGAFYYCEPGTNRIRLTAWLESLGPSPSVTAD